MKGLRAFERYSKESGEMIGFSNLVKQLYSTDFEKQEIDLAAFKDVGKYRLVRQCQSTDTISLPGQASLPVIGRDSSFLSGRVTYSRIAFNKNRTKACFMVMVGYQTSIIEKLMLVEKQAGKWVIVFEKMFAVS